MSAKNRKPLIKQYVDPIYNATLEVLINITHENTVKYLESVWGFEYDDWEMNNDAMFSVHENQQTGIRVYVLCYPDFDNTLHSHSYLVHEILHFVVTMLSHAGLSLTEESEEAYTYSMGYWYKTIFEDIKAINKRKVRRNKAAKSEVDMLAGESF